MKEGRNMTQWYKQVVYLAVFCFVNREEGYVYN